MWFTCVLSCFFLKWILDGRFVENCGFGNQWIKQTALTQTIHSLKWRLHALNNQRQSCY